MRRSACSVDLLQHPSPVREGLFRGRGTEVREPDNANHGRRLVQFFAPQRIPTDEAIVVDRAIGVLDEICVEWVVGDLPLLLDDAARIHIV